MSAFEETKQQLTDAPRVWAVTGAAGFIGSALIEALLSLGQTVRGLDNLSTGYQSNLDDVKTRVGANWKHFDFHQGDVQDLQLCRNLCDGADFVLHQAALGSVPRSVKDPIATHKSNVDGFISMIEAAKSASVQRFVFASSSSVYGTSEKLPKVEDEIGECVSPYAVSKRVDELYAAVFARCYGLRTVGLRYFNVFGRRQDPHGAYAAVIPRWIGTMMSGEPCQVFGDGSYSRDFCDVDNVVQANILAATKDADSACEIYNVGQGGRTTLLELYAIIAANVRELTGKEVPDQPSFAPVRAGDVPHSQASIEKLQQAYGYAPKTDLKASLVQTVEWFAKVA